MRSPKSKQKGGERGTSAPVTSADRHTGTKEVKEGNAHKEKRRGAERKSSTTKEEEYECTCHVCGQAHKYKEKGFWPLVVKSQ